MKKYQAITLATVAIVVLAALPAAMQAHHEPGDPVHPTSASGTFRIFNDTHNHPVILKCIMYRGNRATGRRFGLSVWKGRWGTKSIKTGKYMCTCYRTRAPGNREVRWGGFQFYQSSRREFKSIVAQCAKGLPRG